MTLILLAHCPVDRYPLHAIMDMYRRFLHIMQTHSITLGLNIGSEGKVTRQMWDSFVSETVCAMLEYCTITDAQGIYKGEIEQSKVLSVSTDSPAVIQSLKEVAQSYKKQFRQDAIMYSVTSQSVTFA